MPAITIDATSLKHLERCLLKEANTERRLILHNTDVDGFTTSEAIHAVTGLERERTIRIVLLAHTNGSSLVGCYDLDLALDYKDQIEALSGANLSVIE